MWSLYILALFCTDFGLFELRILRPTQSEQFVPVYRGRLFFFCKSPYSKTVVLSSIRELLCFSSVYSANSLSKSNPMFSESLN